MRKHYQKKSNATTAAQPAWADLLKEAVEKPGRILEAYSYFHNYSLGNQLLALHQCALRGLRPGPVSTYQGWQSLTRQVRKGERAIVLCMPVTRKVGAEGVAEGADDARVVINFIYRPNWFVLCQTDGEELPPAETPRWDRARALRSLGVEEIPFDETNGNIQGYARKRQISVSPIAALPHKTTFHELAHVLLGHTGDASFADSEHTPHNLMEAEAEAVALLCCESLGLEGAEYARGYIQNWLKGDVIPEKSAQKIFRAADSILKAGASGGKEVA
jgi:antirestriction protein ArdC